MAAIIKSATGHSKRSAKTIEPVAFNFNDMASRADDYLGNIRDQAAQIIAEAHQQAEQVRRQAEKAGRQAAEEAVERILDEKVGQRMETLLPAMEQIGVQLADARSAWQEYWERSAVALSARLAERIIRRELREQPEIALDMVRQALELAAGSEQITVRLNPIDHQNLGSQVATLAETLCQLAPADVLADEDVSPGGCRVTTQFGEIDNQIEAQLARLGDELA